MEDSKIVRNILRKLDNEKLIGEMFSKLSQSGIANLQLATSKGVVGKNTPVQCMGSDQLVKIS